MTRRFTLDEVLDWNICTIYEPEKVSRLFGRRKYMTVERLLALDIPDKDKLCCLLRVEVIPEPELHELGCKFAERALRQQRRVGAEPDSRSCSAIAVMRRWIRGKASTNELKAARTAARAATFAVAKPQWPLWMAQNAVQGARIARSMAARGAAAAAFDATFTGVRCGAAVFGGAIRAAQAAMWRRWAATWMAKPWLWQAPEGLYEGRDKGFIREVRLQLRQAARAAGGTNYHGS